MSICPDCERKIYRIINTEWNEVYEWTVPQILEEINRDHSDEWSAYDENDWREGLSDCNDLEIICEVTDTSVRVEAEVLKTLLDEVISYHEDGWYPLKHRGTVIHLAAITKAILAADQALLGKASSILQDDIKELKS